MPIYCDESGFSGVNLLDENQPYFVYAAISIEELEAREIIEEIKTQLRLPKANELKAKSILKYPRGRQQLLQLFENFSDKAKIITDDKKFALAGKIYECFFEPLISSRNTFFYQIGFNKYIQHILYRFFLKGGREVIQFFEDFQNKIREKSNNLNERKIVLDQEETLNKIFEIIYYHDNAFIEEVTDESGNMIQWTLELTQKNLYSLLCSWGQVYTDGMNVICDNSKPIEEGITGVNLLNQLSSGKISTHNLFGYDIPINYNLSVPIVLGDSKDYYGLQVADLFASTLNYALKNREKINNDFCHKIIQLFLNNSLASQNNTYCVMPDYTFFVENVDKAELYGMLLSRFAYYSRNGKSIIDEFDKEINELL